MIITIANEKGGSGKSTLCLNLCVQLLLDKKDIAALDTDSQKSLEVFNNIRSETSLPNFALFNRTGNITDTLKQMMDKYEYILIDTKGEHSKESQRAMLLSDWVLIPTTPSQLDTAVLLDMLERIRDIQALNENVKHPTAKAIGLPRLMLPVGRVWFSLCVPNHRDFTEFELQRIPYRSHTSYYLQRRNFAHFLR
ncbi:hypothetical protein HpBT333_04230 [Helicobacter pylori]